MAISTISIRVYCQSVFEVTIINYDLSINNISEASFIDSAYLTYDTNCLNQIDSIHLKNMQRFDSVRCPFLHGIDLDIRKNDSIIDKVVFKLDRNGESFSKILRVGENEYDNYFSTEKRTILLDKILVSEKTWSRYTPDGFYLNEAEDSMLMVFDSLNYLFEKCYFENGFLTKVDYASVTNGKEINDDKGVIEYSYLFIKNSIQITIENKVKGYKGLMVISFETSFGMNSMSKFILLHLLRNSLVGAAYDVHYPILLSHFPELMEKLR